MPLKDIKKELYDPDSEIEKREHEASQFDPVISAESESDEFQEKGEWIKPKKGLSASQEKAIKVGLAIVGAVAVLALIIWGVIKIKNSAFDESRVTLKIEGIEKVDSTRLVEYKIVYKNDNRTALEDAEIFLNYSENFQPEDNVNLEYVNSGNSKIYLGKIESRSEKEVGLKGKFYAPEGYVVYLKATLQYRPSNFNSVFVTESKKSINVKSSPILLEIDAPLEAADGNDIEYLVDYENISSRYFNNLRLEVEYPEGFDFSSGDPQPSEGESVWYLGNLNAGDKGQIKIRGSIAGSENEAKVVKLKLGALDDNSNFVTYGEREKLTRIITSPLSISQTVNGLTSLNVRTGDELKYKLIYRNGGVIGLKDVIITAKIESSILDLSKIRGGSYNDSNSTITWKAVDIPQLANLQPGDGGSVDFSVPVLGKIPTESDRDKNFTIVSVAKIDSPDIPTSIGSNKIIGSNKLEIKLNSTVILDTEVRYGGSSIENSGPVPPEVGKETTYTIRWSVTNVHNDISGAKVTSSLPTGVEFTGEISPDSEEERISFNERTNQIIWDVGNLDNGIGVIGPKKEVSFQVSVTPQASQVGKGLVLLNSSTIIAEDLFTSDTIKSEIKEKSNKISDDINYKVVE
ncbi:hypothetical protein BMS3Abin15_00450 [bacterium BMS3Abin15]|nr:hypothetical protein BMS3Abin15_00450 [bacterium BMS3Abin15]